MDLHSSFKQGESYWYLCRIEVISSLSWKALSLSLGILNVASTQGRDKSFIMGFIICTLKSYNSSGHTMLGLHVVVTCQTPWLNYVTRVYKYPFLTSALSPHQAKISCTDHSIDVEAQFLYWNDLGDHSDESFEISKSGNIFQFLIQFFRVSTEKRQARSLEHRL